MTPTRFVTLAEGACVPLRVGTDERFEHVFEQVHIDAINTALACRRPLLLTGEPGVGKTQLARAAAVALKRAFVSITVDVRTEARDLLWRFDAVARLADAQMAHALGDDIEARQARLDPANYLVPEALWWGMNWESAEGRHLGPEHRPAQRDGGNPGNGVVVLIDEIDKAEIDVPNGLLEVLADGCFKPEGMKERVWAGRIAPLVVITSNAERDLPDAFVRRCAVLGMEWPDEEQQNAWLKRRGEAHTKLTGEVRETVLEGAAKAVIKDREQALENDSRPLPGLAEYLDLIRAVEDLLRDPWGEAQGAEKLLASAGRYLLNKRKALQDPRDRR